MYKRGQVTIFIIAGVLIVSLIALFFLFRSGIVSNIGGKTEKNPNPFLETCLNEKVAEGIDLISLQGGYVENPLNIYFKFEDAKSPQNISYLCYTEKSYSKCVPQEIQLTEHIENELSTYISEDVRDCFDELGRSLEKQGYVVDASYGGFDINLIEGEVVIKIDGEISLTKTGETSKQEDFEVIIPSRIYELSEMAQEIVNKESTNGNFDHYEMFLYKDFDINKYKTSDSSVIYTIKHRKSEEEFQFAVRGAVMPSGFGLEFE